jgi:Tfp pilus assembly protein FimV
MLNIKSQYAAVLLAGCFCSSPGSAQDKPAAVPSTYVLKRGDSVLAISQHIRYPKASVNQMAYAIIHANLDALGQRTTEVWRPGATLSIPDEATVLKTDTKTADAYIARVVKSDARYREAVALEQKGDMKGAVAAYLDAAKIGHVLADLRLGQLYDTDRTKTLPHDLQESIRHYQKARARGLTIEEAERRGVREKP